jgi:hypothetical protein
VKERHDHRDLIRDGRIILKLSYRNGVSVEWIKMVQDKVQYWVVVSTVISFRVQQKGGNFLIR